MVVVGLIFAPPAIESALGGFRDIFETFRETWFKDWGAGLGGSQTELGWFIEYEDGTKEEFSPEERLPFTVLYEDKAVRYFGFRVYIKVDYTKEIAWLDGSADLQLQISRGSDAKDWIATVTTNKIPEPNVWTEFQYATISTQATTVEEFDAGRLETYTLTGKASVTVDLDFEDGTSQSLSGQAEGSITLNVVESATLDVEVRPVTVSALPTNLS